MKWLYPLLWCTLWLPHLSLTARADDFCAVTVHVVNSKGELTGGTWWIALDDASGTTIRRERVRGHTYKICDFGFGPHTLRAGTGTCLPVAISNVRVVFGEPITLHLILDEGCYDSQRSACLVYFRVVGTDGNPVPGAVLSSGSKVWANPTDSYGRWQDLMGGAHDITFRKPGFEPATLHISCRDAEELDRQVQMKRTGAK